MANQLIDRKQVLKTIFLFLGILISLSAIFYFAILKLNPTSIYVSALMICPAFSALATLKILKRPISSLPWNLKKAKYLSLSYVIPFFYITIAYFLIWFFGFGNILNQETIIEWSQELGMEDFSIPSIILSMVVLLSIVGVVKNMGSTLGEEIGWRGFFIYELRKIFSFGGVSIISGLIWSLWHWPIILLIYKGSGNVIFHISSFTVMILGMSVIFGLLYF